jgi:hypothetical protein
VLCRKTTFQNASAECFLQTGETTSIYLPLLEKLFRLHRYEEPLLLHKFVMLLPACPLICLPVFGEEGWGVVTERERERSGPNYLRMHQGFVFCIDSDV